MPVKKYFLRFFSPLFILVGLGLSLTNLQAQSANSFRHIQLIDDSINPATAEYIQENISKAAASNQQGLILELDTPGGLLTSTRSIVKSILKSEIPVIVYISPSGSRAGSAGVFITYASHVAVMAPGTNIGAAHPVNIGGEQPNSREDNIEDLLQHLADKMAEQNQQQTPENEESSAEVTSDKIEEETITTEEIKEKEVATPSIDEVQKASDTPMADKIVNDTVAFIRSLAQLRNRNEEWAVKSVVDSESIVADEALENNVIDFIATDMNELMMKLDGRDVTINDQTITLNTKNAQIDTVPMTLGQKIFNILANPNIAYLLLMLGFYGLLYEFANPGFGIPGILGITFLIIGTYSMQILPTNYAGLALTVFGLLLLVSEVFIPGFGLFTLGGVVCLVLGSLLLFETADPIMQVSRSIIFAIALPFALGSLFLLRYLWKTRLQKSNLGEAGLKQMIGKVKKEITPDQPGKVFAHGELWTAKSTQTISIGTEVKIIKTEGLTVTVEPIDKTKER